MRGSLVSSAATTSNLLVGLLFTLAPLVFILSESPLPESQAALASVFAVHVYVMLHAAIGVVLAGYGLWRWRTGFISFHSSLDLAIGRLWQDYTAIIDLVGLAFPFAFERLGQTGG
ncbi:hypothetical protein J2045_003818 [Peteryoungia aggregata LMG 23059]|uniref:Uncharacterized protein n=1 Tax=Peteryoungia aggregata LMG 23059 TaxID=1368425 RepID=A0ABU0GCD0_9HYPH|nr:hypothetical protein [Peteryoungia aggregata]MDQ0422768.1 hypothetical protein [Peteryoungia aggregata LMG 23059]